MSAEKAPFVVHKRPDSTDNVLVLPVQNLYSESETPSAEILLRDLDSQMKRDKVGAAAPPVPVARFRQHLDDWLFECKFDNQSPRTMSGKDDAIKRFLWWLDKYQVESFTRMDVKRYLHYVANAHATPAGRWDNGKPCKNGSTHPCYKPVSDRTIQLYFVYIKGYLKFLQEEEIIPESPVANVRQPKIGKREKVPLNVQTEFAALLGAAYKSRSSRRDVALLLFMLDSGARVSEVCGLHLNEIDIDAGTALVLGKGNKQRTVYFELETARAIRAYLKSNPCRPEHYLFRSYGGHTKGCGMTRRGIAGLFTYLQKSAGITGKRIAPHLLRHTFATALANSGCPPKALQQMLGHVNMEMTMRYIHSSDSETREHHREHCAVRGLRRKSK